MSADGPSAIRRIAFCAASAAPPIRPLPARPNAAKKEADKAISQAQTFADLRTRLVSLRQSAEASRLPQLKLTLSTAIAILDAGRPTIYSSSWIELGTRKVLFHDRGTPAAWPRVRRKLGGRISGLGLLLARSDSGAAIYGGLSYFALYCRQTVTPKCAERARSASLAKGIEFSGWIVKDKAKSIVSLARAFLKQQHK